MPLAEHLAGGQFFLLRMCLAYVIVRVGSVAERPAVADILVDPVSLRQDGVLDYSSRNLLVVVGGVVQTNLKS
ncbi:hypothetical protein Q31b_57580 [Novipirellula aureliae]|uniref:Uncharacterized protein n=1 Tax=Novipirellula aureliae TaxID=2527966 RepID=A0A5C6DCJ2_9BACT|nr:hypothetical protein Q31b_57580 [Novipirellula aureliae]